MRLLDRVLAADAESLVAEAQIRAGGLFGDAHSVESWVGIEYMAQAIAAWAGWQRRSRGEAPRVGYLLGTRRYACDRPAFAVGTVLRVTVQREYQADNGLGQFNCRIEIGGQTVAQAALTVLDPPGAAREI
jgi:predicted hotdog family 3-hydroxylacyl-ACP dehydratase